ncbi:hypothetical protein JTB14_012505 [Gonioctena quinquepunctata]|nr:hypothetical protein JTB14_012505 [Gonioctena quinquepunctata]
MNKDNRNIPPDPGIKDKPPEEAAADSQYMQVPTQANPEQENKSERGELKVKFQFEKPLRKESERDTSESKKGEVSPDTPEPYVDCSSSTPNRHEKATEPKDWKKSENSDDEELEKISMLITNMENDSVLQSLGEGRHTSEVRETGLFGPSADLKAQEANDYGQSFVPNNSKSPSNASTTEGKHTR